MHVLAGCRMTICSKEDGGLVFSCKGVIGSIEYPVQHQEMQDEDEEPCNRVVQAGEVKQDFAMRHLSTYTKATDLTPTVWLYLQQGNPLMLKYEMGDLGELVFVLAPKVDESEDEEDMS